MVHFILPQASENLTLDQHGPWTGHQEPVLAKDSRNWWSLYSPSSNFCKNLLQIVNTYVFPGRGETRMLDLSSTLAAEER